MIDEKVVGIESIAEFDSDQFLSAEERIGYMNEIYQSSGIGTFENLHQQFFTGIDRVQQNMMAVNIEHSGFTFISRPKLMLTNENLQTMPEFAPLLFNSDNSISTAIRHLLDTELAQSINHAGRSKYVNYKNAFFIPLMNSVHDMSGFPDMNIETKTSDVGFHSEDNTFAIGYDELSKTYNITIGHKDIQNGPIAAIYFYWLLYMGYMCKGKMDSYHFLRNKNKLPYTVSIYRFMVDPQRQVITKYLKATGCFPTSLPIGGMFNMSATESISSDSQKFTVPFICNKVEINNYKSIMDFNILSERYAGIDMGEAIGTARADISAGVNVNDTVLLPLTGSNNYRGIPYIDTSRGKLELVFLDG